MQAIALDKAQALSERLRELAEQESPCLDRILKLRLILEQLYKAATENDPQSFNGLFARMQFANTQAGVSNDLARRSHQLRILCNRVAHEEVKQASHSELDFGLHTIYQLIGIFYPGFRDAVLEKYFSTRSISFQAQLPQATKQSFLCVDSWAVRDNTLQIEAVRDDGSFCLIRLNNESDKSGHDGRMWTNLAKSLWRYASLFCHHLTEVSGHSDSFMSNPNTLVVLEPDFLIDASSLASCFSGHSGDPALFILNHLFGDSSSEAKLQGSLVNAIFDELVFEKNKDYLELFKQGLASLPLAMVSLGKEAAVNIYNRIANEHLPQLKHYLDTLGEAELLLEPSFLCPDYGLQGRLDLLSKTGDSYGIVELKSGKAPANDVWASHQMQVIAYNMIIRNTFGAKWVSNASILYSAAKENPIRHVVNVAILEQDLLMCRNRIVGIMHSLSEEPARFLNWLRDCEPSATNTIAKAKYDQFRNLAQVLEDYEWEWFLSSVQRVVREIWFVKTGDNGLRNESGYGHNALWQQGRAEKQAAYKLISGLIPISYNKQQISFTIPETDEITDFREGDIVVLYEQQIPVTRQEVLRGVISSLKQKQLDLNIRGGLKNSQRLNGNSQWAIEHDTLESSLYSPLTSLTQFLGSPPAKRRLFLGIDAPVSPGDPANQLSDIEQIISMMHAADDLFIVQGPPGTGKTSGLLSTYISEIYQQSEKNILVLSFTNRAVDEICLCLSRKAVPFIRTGASQAIETNLLSNMIHGKRFEEMEGIIKANRIWIATVQSATAWYRDMQKLLSFDEIIVDEASQIIESGILGIIAQAPKTILIGDQNQLPPITVQNSLPFNFSHARLQALAYGSYGQSLMERLHRVFSENGHSRCMAMLRKHYRMHEKIADLVAENYANQLVAVLPQQQADLQVSPALPPWLDQRLLWVDCPPSSDSHYDSLQVKLISKILMKMQTSGVINDLDRAVGIVAPFRAMIHALRKELGQTIPEVEKISIDTVERFQGSERGIIIICLPIRHENDLQQLSSVSGDGSIDRKLNVAVSRAKERLIILGNAALCSKSSHYRKLVDKIRSSGNLVSSDLAEQEL